MAKDAAVLITFIDDEALLEAIKASLGSAIRLENHVSAESFGEKTSREKLGEPLTTGQTANLTRHLSTTQPGLLLFDLNNQAIPTDKWLPIIKTSPATRRIPTIVLCDELTPEQDKAWRSRGADRVLTADTFITSAPNIVKNHMRQHDKAGISSACAEPLSDLALEGIHLFNKGDFFEAHEELEHAWNADKTPARDFYRAILQVAVTYLQIERGNYRGAVKMILRVRQWLMPLPDRCRGIDIAQLKADVELVDKQLQALGADNIGDFDQSLFNQIKLPA